MLALLFRRRFGPLFGVQFLGAFNDNLFKTAMLFLVTYRLLAEAPDAAARLVTLAAGIFILPFFLFSGLAGQLADAHDKARLIRIIKLAEILIMAAGAAAMAAGAIPAMLTLLFLMGAHSTFFGPIKYSILPQHLAAGEIMGGTALVEAGTFVAILTGQIVAGLIAPEAAMAGMLIVAMLGYVAARAVPPAPPAPGPHPVRANIAASSLAVLKGVFAAPALGRAVILISWFWSLGTLFTTLFIPLVRGALGGVEAVATLFLTAFSLGVAAGSLIIARWLRGRISVKTLPASLLLMSLAILDMFFAVSAYPAPTGALMGVGAFLALPASWRVLADLVLLAAAAGSFIVPLYAVLQTASDANARARTIAANNIVNAGTMAATALGAGALLGAGLGTAEVLLAGGAVNLLAIPLALSLRKVV